MAATKMSRPSAKNCAIGHWKLECSRHPMADAGRKLVGDATHKGGWSSTACASAIGPSGLALPVLRGVALPPCVAAMLRPLPVDLG